MDIKTDLVIKMGQLARLDLKESEIQSFQKDLGDILTYVEMLDELDLEGVTETAHPFMQQMRLREDRATPFAATSSLIANSSDTADHQFRVPRIISEK